MVGVDGWLHFHEHLNSQERRKFQWSSSPNKQQQRDRGRDPRRRSSDIHNQLCDHVTGTASTLLADEGRTRLQNREGSGRQG